MRPKHADGGAHRVHLVRPWPSRRRGSPEACVAIAYAIANVCVSTKTVKIGTQMRTDSFTPRMLMSVSPITPATANASLKCLRRGREEAEQRVGAARHRYGDGQDVVDQESAAREDAQRRGKELARHQVAAAARRKQRDDLRIARADRDDRDDRGERHEQAQVRVPAERLERLLRAVAGRRQPVRAEAYPREERDQRELVEQVCLGQGLRSAEDERFEGHVAVSRICFSAGWIERS